MKRSDANVSVRYSITGTLAGPIWWPYGEMCSKPFEWVTYDRPDTMRQIGECVMAREDGDFSSAPRMMADTMLTITRTRGMSSRSRSWYTSDLPSLSDYTSSDFVPWEEATE